MLEASGSDLDEVVLYARSDVPGQYALLVKGRNGSHALDPTKLRARVVFA